MPGQLAAIDGEVERLGSREVVSGPYFEEKASGWKADRGPELEAALEAAEAAADKFGAAELWVWKSERLARGSGRKNEARSLLEVFNRMRRAGVTLRSVLDDAYVQDEAMIGMASKMANKYSADLSEAVKAGKRRQRERREVHGGPTRDGYTLLREGESRRYVIDPTRRELIAHLWALALEGVAPPRIARVLNGEGHRTEKGRPWDRRSVEDKLMNAFYAGGVHYFPGKGEEAGEQIVWDAPVEIPAYVTREQWEAVQAMRVARDRAPGADRTPGRPNERHLLAGLAYCSRCGSKMRPRTASYKRKDGSKNYSYTCAEVVAGTGLCDAPVVNGEIADRELAHHLDMLFVNEKAFLDKLTVSRRSEVEAVEANREREQVLLAKLRKREAALQERYADEVADGADTAAATGKALARFHDEAEQVAERIVALDEVLAAKPSADDERLDLWNALHRRVKDALGRSQVPEIREGLAELFERFDFDTTDDGIVIVPKFVALDGPLEIMLSPDFEPGAVSFRPFNQRVTEPTHIVPEGKPQNTHE